MRNAPVVERAFAHRPRLQPESVANKDSIKNADAPQLEDGLSRCHCRKPGPDPDAFRAELCEFRKSDGEFLAAIEVSLLQSPADTDTGNVEVRS
jgi:hypothetical protein